MAQKKAKNPSTVEHLNFGGKVYTVQQVGDIFWGVCVALGDSATRSAKSREDLIDILKKDTGENPAEFKPPRTTACAANVLTVYTDGVTDIQLNGVRIKGLMKHKRGSRNSYDFSGMCGLTWEDFYEETIDLSMTIEKVRFQRKDGTPLTVEFPKSTAPEISRPYYLDEILTGLFFYILGCNADVSRAFIDILGSDEDVLSFSPVNKPNPHIPFEMALVISQALGIYHRTYDDEDSHHVPLDWPDTIFFGFSNYEEFSEALTRTVTNARIISELPL